MGNVKKETISGVKWGLLQKCTLQPLQFVYGIIIARLITPAEFGILGLTGIFFAVAGTLATAGLGSALIRKQDRTEADCSTMFWFNWGMSCLMGAILFSAAPWFAEWYHQPELLWLTRVSALLMTITCTGSVHWSLYSARRDFKTPAIINMVTAILSMPICATLAYLGFSIWSVVIANVSTSLVSLAAVWICSPWKPRLMWSNDSFKQLFSFGSKLAAASLLHTLYTQSRTFIIGKFYSPAQLGYYGKGAHMAQMAPMTIEQMLGSVTYPILSTLQHDDDRLNLIYKKYIQITSLPIIWGVFTVAALAEPLVGFLYGDDWLPAAHFTQIVCFSWYCVHVSTINLNLLKVKGRTDIMLYLQIVKKTLAILAMIYAATISVEAICWAAVICCQFDLTINCIFCGSLIKRTWWDQQKDYIPYAVCAVLANVPAFLLTQTTLPHIVILMLGGLSSVVLYLGIMLLRKDAALSEYWGMLKNKPFVRRWLAKLGIHIAE